MNKTELRTKAKAQRRSLDISEREDLSRRIINHAFEVIDWSGIRSLHVYLPMQNEIDTLPFIRAARQQIPDLKVATSWRDGREVKTNWLDESNEIGKPVKAGYRFGLIVVPMLAFDGRGYRLGYGGGFYDRFLPTQPDALTVGLCYEFGRQNKLPHEDHDVPLDLIVTEDHVYKF